MVESTYFEDILWLDIEVMSFIHCSILVMSAVFGFKRRGNQS